MVTIDKERIKQAIQKAERRTSGEIRVSVSPLFWGDVRKAAEKAFDRLGMTATKDRNAVLFFVVPARRKFVVLGDSGIHEKVGQEFWHHIVRTVSESSSKVILRVASSPESKQWARTWPSISPTTPPATRTNCRTTSIDPQELSKARPLRPARDERRPNFGRPPVACLTPR